MAALKPSRNVWDCNAATAPTGLLWAASHTIELNKWRWRRHLNTHLLYCNITKGSYDLSDQLAALFSTSPVDTRECGHEPRSRY